MGRNGRQLCSSPRFWNVGRTAGLERNHGNIAPSKLYSRQIVSESPEHHYVRAWNDARGRFGAKTLWFYPLARQPKKQVMHWVSSTERKVGDVGRRHCSLCHRHATDEVSLEKQGKISQAAFESGEYGVSYWQTMVLRTGYGLSLPTSSLPGEIPSCQACLGVATTEPPFTLSSPG